VLYAAVTHLIFTPMPSVKFTHTNVLFFATLQKRVREYFATNDIKLTGNFRLYLKTGILASFVTLCYVILVFTPPQGWVSLLICALLGAAMAGVGFNVMHDGNHGSYSSRKWVNKLMALSLNFMGGDSFIWRTKHNIVHHSFTNINGIDDDIDIEPWIRVHDDQPRYWYHRFQNAYWILLYGITYGYWVLYKDFIRYFSGKIKGTKMPRMKARHHFTFWITKLAYIFAFIVLPIFNLGLIETLIGYIVMCFVCGLAIGVVFQLAHVVSLAEFPNLNNETGKMDNDWAVHQVMTTANFATKNKLVTWFTGGLNFQVEHHLFPRISHVHYPKISRLVKDTCAQFNIPYHEHRSVFSALRSHVVFLKLKGSPSPTA
jgi:linoleoyl-CoA desaturase